jgi:hypothetical protein
MIGEQSSAKYVQVECRERHPTPLNQEFEPYRRDPATIQDGPTRPHCPGEPLFWQGSSALMGEVSVRGSFDPSSQLEGSNRG